VIAGLEPNYLTFLLMFLSLASCVSFIDTMAQGVSSMVTKTEEMVRKFEIMLAKLERKKGT
jgi:uncharacterized membrane protein